MTLFEKFFDTIKRKGVGVGLCLIFAIAAMSFNHSYGVPAMLMGLLLGMAMSQLYRESERCQAGVDFASKSLLRSGIVLIGFRFTAEDFAYLGWLDIAALSILAGATILVGVGLSKLFNLPKKLGVLSGSAVGICGASAAMAVSAVIDSKGRDKHLTALTIAAVTSLSSLAMLLYPVIGKYLGFNDSQIAYLLGASIHDVAQVVGAGYSVSTGVGEQAVLVKLIRILNLLPVIIVIALLMSHTSKAANIKRSQVMPTFLIVFIVVAAINLLIAFPPLLLDSVNRLSSYLILVSIVAIGLKTDIKQLFTVGYLPLVLICLETVFLLTAVILVVYLNDYMVVASHA